ncbi:hypothetical protein F5Y15DRAFT_413845 [Xylariaceae sp. FL0016]|nr:hypothetical protein F5Y15DRAFT_413845 [Xylariaceae sp. FL0016]
MYPTHTAMMINYSPLDMPPSEIPHNDTGEDTVKVTSQEFQLISAIFARTPLSKKPSNGGDLDWKSVASQVGLTNANTARNRFHLICRKFGWFRADEPEDPPVVAPGAVPTRKSHNFTQEKMDNYGPSNNSLRLAGQKDRFDMNDHGMGENLPSGEEIWYDFPE